MMQVVSRARWRTGTGGRCRCTGTRRWRRWCPAAGRRTRTTGPAPARCVAGLGLGARLGLTPPSSFLRIGVRCGCMDPLCCRACELQADCPGPAALHSLSPHQLLLPRSTTSSALIFCYDSVFKSFLEWFFFCRRGHHTDALSRLVSSCRSSTGCRRSRPPAPSTTWTSSRRRPSPSTSPEGAAASSDVCGPQRGQSAGCPLHARAAQRAKRSPWPVSCSMCRTCLPCAEAYHEQRTKRGSRGQSALCWRRIVFAMNS